MSSEELKEAITRLKRPAQAGVDLSPRSAFDALLDARLKELEAQVEELKGRVHGLMFLVVGAVIVQVVLSFFK
ncbi:MAG: hypothetical protein HY531_02250 [Chloroflexi bacterium]|nr:hypothetical protein [Chloroflexota bacterium]